VFQFQKFCDDPAEFLFEDDYRETIRLKSQSTDITQTPVREVGTICKDALGCCAEFLMVQQYSCAAIDNVETRTQRTMHQGGASTSKRARLNTNCNDGTEAQGSVNAVTDDSDN
jgi:hypothetical protein